MKLYEINQEIENCINNETGEITDFSKLEALTLAKEEKVKNIALIILNKRAEEKAIDDQLKKFLARKKSIKNEIMCLEYYLEKNTAGQSYNFAEVKVGYLHSEETIITDIEALEKYAKRHKELGKYKFEPIKTAIKEAIGNGLKVKGAEIVRKQNLQIK